MLIVSTGGTFLTISGTGFGPGVQAKLGGKNCTTVSASYTNVVCRTPPVVRFIRPAYLL